MHRMTFDSVRHRILKGGVALFALLAVASLPAHADESKYRVGERVFIPLFAPNLKDDGYADGRIKRINKDGTVDITISKLVNGKDKTMYGTCSPGAESPLSESQGGPGSDATSKTDYKVPVDKIMPWTDGQFTYIERENLSTAIQKWLGGGMGITTNRLDVAARRARELGLPRVLEAVKIARLQVASTGGNGFPVPPEMALRGSAKMLGQVAKELQNYPGAVEKAVAYISGTAPGQQDDLLVEAILHIGDVTKSQLQSLQNDNPDPRKVGGFTPEQIEAIYTGWYRMMTANDTQPYLNAKVAYYQKQIHQEIQAGKWPKLDS